MTLIHSGQYWADLRRELPFLPLLSYVFWRTCLFLCFDSISPDLDSQNYEFYLAIMIGVQLFGMAVASSLLALLNVFAGRAMSVIRWVGPGLVFTGLLAVTVSIRMFAEPLLFLYVAGFFVSGVGFAMVALYVSRIFFPMSASRVVVRVCVCEIVSALLYFWILEFSRPISLLMIYALPFLAVLFCPSKINDEGGAGNAHSAVDRKKLVAALGAFAFVAAFVNQELFSGASFGIPSFSDRVWISYGMIAAIVMMCLIPVVKRKTNLVGQIYAVSFILLTAVLIVTPLLNADTTIAAVISSMPYLFLPGAVCLVVVVAQKSPNSLRYVALCLAVITGCLLLGAAAVKVLVSFQATLTMWIFASLALAVLLLLIGLIYFKDRHFAALVTGESRHKASTQETEAEAEREALNDRLDTLAHEGALSQREREVLALLIKRLSIDEIHEELGISVYTVKAHLRSIYTKLDVHSRSELSQKVKELGQL